ncbi:MAG: transcriptional repressor [Clostridia bacterium]|nr:transcriptional repressor [Clostridia bacterium]
MRSSHQRDAILEYLKSMRAHRSATEIYDAVREKIPNISLGTVYRNLGQLVEAGQIITVETHDKFVYYDGYIKPHTHFVCKACKMIFDFEYETTQPEPITSQGFKIENERTVYYGLCKKCIGDTPQ